MIIKNIATYLENLKQKDIKPEIFTVWPFPEGLTVLEILNSIGYKLAHLWDSVKINTTTETTDDATAQVSVTGDVDQLNFDFKIPRGKDGEKGDPGVSVTVGKTTTLAAGEAASVTNSGTASDPILNFEIPRGAKGDKGEPGPDNLVMITATASTTTQGDYTPNVNFTDALANIQASKVVCIKLESLPGRFYIPYSSSSSEILASAGTVSGSNQSIELYTIRWAADTNIISITGTKEGCIADGGQAGQVLAKKSNESFDAQWIENFHVFNTSTINSQIYNNIVKKVPCFLITNENRMYTLFYGDKGAIYGFSEVAINPVTNIISTVTVFIPNNDTTEKQFSTNVIYGVPKGGTTGQILAKKSDTPGDVEWVDAGTGFLINANAGAHNSIYRGKYLGTNVTAVQYASIAAGTFDDLYIGDFWTIDGVNYRIAAFNYYLNCGDVTCTTNHVVIVPDTPISNASMNSTNTTIGGYVGSAMYTANLEQAKTIIKGTFSGHVLRHRIFITNAVSNGIPSNGAWRDSEIELMCEQMVYGSGIFSPVSNGSITPANYCVEKSQLPLFRHEPSRICNGNSWWLRNIIDGSNFSNVGGNGLATISPASNSYGIRPSFCIS